MFEKILLDRGTNTWNRNVGDSKRLLGAETVQVMVGSLVHSCGTIKWDISD